MKVRTQTNLVKRGSVWTFRKKVPPDLRQHYGKESIRLTLSSFSAQSDAKREAARLAADYEAQFSLIRKSRAPVSSRPLTPELVPQLAKALEGHILGADEATRAEGMDEDTFAFWESEIGAAAAEVRRAYARGDASPIDAALDDWLTHLGIDAVPGSPELSGLRREFLKARLKALDGQLSRNQGQLVETPAAPSVASLGALQTADSQTAKGAPKLADVLDYWKAIGAKSHRTTSTADVIVREFITLNGNLPLSEVSKGHFVALRDNQLARVKPATVAAPVLMAVTAAMTAAAAASQYAAAQDAASKQEEANNNKKKALDQQRDGERMDLERQQQAEQEAAAAAGNAHAMQATKDMASFMAITGESGGGVSAGRGAAAIGIQNGQDMATLASNSRKQQVEIGMGDFASRNRNATAKASIQSVAQPSALQAGLTIAGAGVNYQKEANALIKSDGIKKGS